MTLEDAQNYFIKKYSEWNLYPGGFKKYIKDKKNILQEEFNQDKGNPNHDFNNVCKLLREYESTKQDDIIEEILSLLNTIENPENDIIKIIEVAILKACFPNSEKVNTLIEKIIIGVVIGGAIALAIKLLKHD
jgi:hypothetical protein